MKLTEQHSYNQKNSHKKHKKMKAPTGANQKDCLQLPLYTIF
jgi:hypothetical protein